MQHSRLRVKQWQLFEPFTHRTAPWGPVYQEVLTQLGLQHLESADAQALVMLLLIGSDQQGFLPSHRAVIGQQQFFIHLWRFQKRHQEQGTAWGQMHLETNGVFTSI